MLAGLLLFPTYLITFEITFDSTTPAFGIWNQVYLAKNGSGRYAQQLIQVAGAEMHMSSSCQIRLITNDTIELYVYQNSGSNRHVGSVGDGIGRIQITKLF